MKKTLAIITIITSLILFGLFSILFFIDYDAVYKNFLNNIKVEIGASNISPIKVNRSFIPYLVIDNVSEEGKIELQQIEIRFSILSLISFNPKIDNLKIGTARINLGNKEWNVVNHENLIADFISKGGSKVNIEVANLYLLDETNNPKVIIKNLSLLNNGSFKGAVNDVGDFMGSFSESPEGIKFHAKVVSLNYDVEAFEIYKSGRLISGNVNCQIKHLGNFLTSSLPDIRSAFSKITNKENINIKFDIIPTDEVLAFRNLEINSPSIEGRGQITLSKVPSISNLIELNFPKINLNNLTGDIENTNSSKSFKNTARFIFADKLLKAEIAIDQIDLSAQEKLTEVKFSGNLENGKFFINRLTGKIDDNGDFAVNGQVEQNAYRSLFNGKVHIRHGNLNNILDNIGYAETKVEKVTPFIFTSDLKCTVIDFYLQNLSLKTDNLKMSGSISSKFIGATPRVRANLNFSALDLSKTDYPVISPLQKFALSFTREMKDSGYLSKFIPIRTISYLGNFDITFNELAVGNTPLGKVNLLVNIAPSLINIDNLYINKGSDYISTNLTLQASGLKPEFSIKINDGVVHANFLTPKSLLELKKLLLKDYSVDKISLKVDGALTEFYQGDLKFDNVKFKIENDNILFKFSDLQAKVLEGDFKGEGSILLEPFTWNFVYALNSVDLAKVSKVLPKGLYDNVGGASINGMLTTNGDTIEKLLYNLYAKSSIVMKDTKINNFDIDGFIEDLTNKDYNLQNLEGDIRNALLTGQTNMNNFESDLELTKGVLTMKNTKFQTKYATASTSATINIYDFGLNLISVFSFYPVDKTEGEINRSYNPVKLNVKAAGSIFEPQKTADTAELLKVLSLKKK